MGLPYEIEIWKKASAMKSSIVKNKWIIKIIYNILYFDFLMIIDIILTILHTTYDFFLFQLY